MIGCDTSLRELERLWGGGRLSNEELIGCLLRYLARQEERSKNQEPKTSHQQPGRTHQEPRARGQGMPICWDMCCALHDRADSQANPHHAPRTTPSTVLGTLLRQLGEALDALTGQQLELWQAEQLWYWRWQDTNEQAHRGLASCGEALVDAVEQRYPDDLLPAALQHG